MSTSKKIFNNVLWPLFNYPRNMSVKFVIKNSMMAVGLEDMFPEHIRMKWALQ